MSTILFVEAVPICREPLAALLKVKGYQVICAGDGQAALDYLCKQRPNLVLLDLMLPKMNGIELLKSMSAHAELKKIPAIVLTNSTDRRHVLAARAAGACEYMLKSAFSLEHLMERIEKYAPMGLQATPATARNAAASAGAADASPVQSTGGASPDPAAAC